MRSIALNIPTWKLASCLLRSSSSSAALLGEQQLAEQVLEGDQDDAEEGDRGDPDHVVDEGDRDREHRAGELGGQHRRQHVELAREGDSLDVAAVAGDHHEVDRQGELEEGEDQQVEGRVGGREPERLDALVEGDPADQREGRVGEQVAEQVVRLVAPAAQPAGEHRGDADQRRRRAAEEDHRQDQGEEGAGDLDLGLGGDRGEVAEDREGEQDPEQGGIPVGLGRVPDADGGSRNQSGDHDADCETGWTLVSHGGVGKALRAGRTVAYIVHGPEPIPCVAVDWFAPNATWPSKVLRNG